MRFPSTFLSITSVACASENFPHTFSIPAIGFFCFIFHFHACFSKSYHPSYFISIFSFQKVGLSLPNHYSILPIFFSYFVSSLSEPISEMCSELKREGILFPFIHRTYIDFKRKNYRHQDNHLFSSPFAGNIFARYRLCVQ